MTAPSRPRWPPMGPPMQSPARPWQSSSFCPIPSRRCAPPAAPRPGPAGRAARRRGVAAGGDQPTCMRRAQARAVDASPACPARCRTPKGDADLPHIALIAPPYAGHVNPMLAIAAALLARGHRATLLHTGASPPAPPGVATLRLDPPPPRGVPFSPLAPVRLPARRTAALLGVLPATLRAIGADL